MCENAIKHSFFFYFVFPFGSLLLFFFYQCCSPFFFFPSLLELSFNDARAWAFLLLFCCRCGAWVLVLVKPAFSSSSSTSSPNNNNNKEERKEIKMHVKGRCNSKQYRSSGLWLQAPQYFLSASASLFCRYNENQHNNERALLFLPCL